MKQFFVEVIISRYLRYSGEIFLLIAFNQKCPEEKLVTVTQTFGPWHVCRHSYFFEQAVSSF